MAEKIQVDGEQLIARARAMIPDLASRANQQARDRRLSSETIEAMKEAGFFRVLQPKRWGGYEMSPRVFAEIQIALAEGDMSTAWVYGVLGVHPFQLALFDDRAAADVWGKDDGVLIASTYMPTGRATPVEDGFRFTGKWKFSSGSEHCDWILLGGLVGDPADGDYRTFLLPRSDYRIEDAWHVMGLKGTGSQDIVVEDVFVPAYRVHDLRAAYRDENPGWAVNSGPLYRVPFVQVFSRVVSNGCIGALQAMLDAFLAYGSKRIGTTGSPTSRDPDAQRAVTEIANAVDEMKLVLHRNFEVLEGYAERREQAPTNLRLFYKHQSSLVAERALELASKLFRSAGGHGLYETMPLGRIYSDLIAARQHVSNQSQVTARNYGAVLLGLDNPDMQV
ncbi:acyl-CoA dehydrogenase family protein [Sphingosinicella terrae]|uniref:acyl-CoA dehydrogenase family protein n=1 Tax=Sphingosinicella terrae TaxID=2172047 RepID=UPI00254775AC|nr:acyl-CoA dehydrogenase family protein [Sphingosinicella terrae]